MKLDPGAAYVHYTTNNTIFGTEFTTCRTPAAVPLVADASSDIFSGPIDVSKFALIYAGAQKNLAPAGVTLAIVRDDMLKRTPSTIPTMLQYGVHVENKSMYNTPPVFAIYVMRLVLAWLLKRGGLAAIAQQNAQKADKLYAEIDRTEFYRGHAQKDSRSRMNVTFRLPTRRARQEVCEGSDRGRAGRPQGAPLGRRDARVDLQRVPRRGGRRARPVHARIRENERLKCSVQHVVAALTEVLQTGRVRTCYCGGSLYVRGVRLSTQSATVRPEYSATTVNWLTASSW